MAESSRRVLVRRKSPSSIRRKSPGAVIGKGQEPTDEGSNGFEGSHNGYPKMEGVSHVSRPNRDDNGRDRSSGGGHAALTSKLSRIESAGAPLPVLEDDEAVRALRAVAAGEELAPHVRAVVDTRHSDFC